MATLRFGRGAVLLALTLACAAGARAGDLEDEFAAQQARAQAGDVPAMYALGEMYELGMGIASSRQEALKWYRAAAERGHAGGAYQLGYAYYWGKGVTRDRREAHVWFLRAAEAGSQPAMPYLSKMYALGQGVPQDKDKAAAWAERASTSSNLHRPPPAPEQTAKPQPEPIAQAPDQATPPAARPAPEPEPAPEQEPEPKPQPKPKPAPKPKPEPRPAPKPKTAKAKPPARVIIEQLLGSHWEKGGRPALYLPSGQTACQDQGDKLGCASAPRRSSLLGRPYAFRLVAVIDGFDADGRFDIRYRPQVTGVLQAGPGGYGEEGTEAIDEAQLRERVERDPQALRCQLVEGGSRLRCEDERGESQVYDAVEPGESTVEFSTPPFDSDRTGAAPPPSLPPQQEAQAESRRIRTVGPPP